MLYHHEAVADVYDIETAHLTEDIPFYLHFARRQGGMVLDLACGTGRVLLPLAENGIIVTGLDVSEAMLVRAGTKMAEQSAAVQSNITLVHADMRDFKLDHTFGLAFIAASSFIALTTADDQERTIRTIYRHLNKDGLLILDTFDPDPAILAQAIGTEWERSFQDGRLRRTERLIATERLSQTRTTRSSYAFESKTFEAESTVRYTYFYELQHLVRLCGFRIEALLQDYEGTPFSTPGGKLLVVARKREKGPDL